MSEQNISEEEVSAFKDWMIWLTFLALLIYVALVSFSRVYLG